MTPNKIIDERDVSSISARGLEGSFTILAHHIDLLSVLERSIVGIQDESGAESVYAIDGGILTKEGSKVQISSALVVKGPGSGTEDPEEGISNTVREAMEELRKESNEVQTASFRMESDLVRRMVELRGEL